MARVTFVTRDGPHQTYLESLFLPIFSRLCAHGFYTDVFQITWAGRDDTLGWAAAAARSGVGFEVMRVPHRVALLSTPASMLLAAAKLARRMRSTNTDVLLARSIVPSGIALVARRSRVPAAFVCDADGLSADERVEFAGWSRAGAPYRIWRAMEAHAIRAADAVIARTEKAKQILAERAGPATDGSKIFVIPNAKDPAVFHPSSAAERNSVRRKHGVAEQAPWLVFVGSVGPQYYLPESLEVFRRLLHVRPDARMHVLTSHVPAASELLRAKGFGPEVHVLRVAPAEVPSLLAAADVGMAFRARTFSQQAVSPIKVAEYLLCGLPVLGQEGVGDVGEQQEGCGKFLDQLSASSLESAAHWIASDVVPEREAWRRRCRAAGEKLFSIDGCAERYAQALRFAVASATSRASGRAQR